MKIADYVIVSAPNLHDLAWQVKQSVEGWQPVGGPFLTGEKDWKTWGQAMMFVERRTPVQNDYGDRRHYAPEMRKLRDAVDRRVINPWKDRRKGEQK